jgi:DNA-binding LacI/PurR family transcriptional regulator
MMPVTIKDLAKIAGVSHTTVSRALRDHPAIAQDTTDRIKRIAAEQGYLPSAVARGLKTRQSRVLGVIVGAIDDPFWSEVLQGIDDVLHPAGYSLFVVASHHEPQREKEIAKAMIERRVDGVILCSPTFRSEHGELFREHELPCVVVNNQGAVEHQYSIYHDDVFGSRQITRHLIELGHQAIAYLGNRAGGRTNQDRLEGWRQEISADHLTLPADYVYHAPEDTPAGGFSGAQRLLALNEPPTAIACYNDAMAVGVYSALSQCGVRIPQDISVTGFDNISLAGYLIPPLTTYHQPKQKLGKSASQLMLQLLEHQASGKPPLERHNAVLSGELRVRSSTSPPGKQLDRVYPSSSVR